MRRVGLGRPGQPQQLRRTRRGARRTSRAAAGFGLRVGPVSEHVALLLDHLAEPLVVVVEELVDESVIRSDPNRTLIPGMIVDAVVVEPWGAHPSYAQGYYDRDNDFYVAWEPISRDAAKLAAYLDEYVYGVPDRQAYLAKQPELMKRLKASARMSKPVNYGF